MSIFTRSKVILCECGKVKGHHGWLTLHKDDVLRLTETADKIKMQECSECLGTRLQVERLNLAREACSCCLDTSEIYHCYKH